MQTLSLEFQPSGSVVCLRAVGDLDLDTQDLFEEVVGQHVSGSSVVVDLSRLEFLAISALRSLLRCQEAAVAAGHEVSYVAASQQVLRLLEVSGLSGVLTVRESVDEVDRTLAANAPTSLRDLRKVDAG